MSVGRVVAALTASLAVGGCAVVVFGMSHADSTPDAAARTTSSAAPTSRPAYVPVSPPSSTQRPVVTARPAAASPTPASTAARAAVTSAVPSAVVTTTHPATHPVTTARPLVVDPQTSRPTTRPGAQVTPRHAAPVARAAPKATGQRLPLRYSTGSATRVITVTARSHGSTVATLQAWRKVAGGWQKYGTSITAHVGAQGIGTASEMTSRTPAGTFTLTQAFGRMSDPGTALPYVKTTPSDYWISDGGRLYNTRQRCGSCGYNDGVNERLYYETPYYNYAVVIDYNTRNAPGGVHAGKGSAFFLHVTDGKPTAGCVAVPQSRLVPLLRWLTPAAHPRILIGVV
ncbi:L,D-transpeptidase family protein [uncultured Jatrophihabitans sp.]|uniref:L,D-transpeptidase family protein n=1 Tax=uncultured Jatrophihabitans sp. TaxID=1610747 RepID=UPI0035C9ABCC